MRKIILSAAAACLFLAAQAQDCLFYFPYTKGATIETKSYNAKDKLTGSSKSVITEAIATSLKFSVETFDEKDKSLGSSNLEMKCENGEVVIDMSQYVKGLSAYKDMDVKINTTKMTIPAKLTAGQKLNDGEVVVTISSGFVNMKMETKIYNRVVGEQQQVTTPAGTFTCTKLMYDMDMKMMGTTTHMKVIDFISDKVGSVRNETYDDKDKLISYTIITVVK